MAIKALMTKKTFLDCIKCMHLVECDAHITGGVHKHSKGSNPCYLVIDRSGAGPKPDNI